MKLDPQTGGVIFSVPLTPWQLLVHPEGQESIGLEGLEKLGARRTSIDGLKGAILSQAHLSKVPTGR